MLCFVLLPHVYAYFSNQTAVFVGGGGKIFLPPGSGYPRYAPGNVSVNPLVLFVYLTTNELPIMHI